MSKFIGRLANVGIAKESSRGTAVTPAFWLPKQLVTIDDQIDQAVDDTSIGVIEDSQDANVAQKYSEGEIDGRIDNTIFGLLLLAALGTETGSVVVGGETIVYDHTFTVAESAQHKSLTISLSEPNASGASAIQYPLAMLTELDLDVELKKFAMYKAKFRANAGATGNVTPSYVAENAFLPQTIIAKFASTYAGLGAASAINVKSVKLNITPNVEDDFVLGNVAAVDRLNKQLSISGEIQLMYSDRSYIDTYLMADLLQAFRLQMVSAATIGSTSHPQITIDLAKVKFSDVARKFDNDNLVLQTLKFDAFYSISDSLMIQAIVRNLQVAVY